MNTKLVKWVVAMAIGTGLVLVGELYERPVLTSLGAPLLALGGVGAGHAAGAGKERRR